MKPALYQAIKKISPAQVRKLVGPEFFCAEQENGMVTEEYYDTFELDLYKKGTVFCKRDTMLYLFSLRDGTDIGRQELTSSEVPQFWWEFPDNAMRINLRENADVRALIPLGKLEEERVFFSIQNSEKKNIARLVLHNRTFFPPHMHQFNPSSLISINPLKGFSTETARIEEKIKTQYHKTSAENVFATLLGESGYLERLNRIQYPPEIEAHWTICHTVKTAAFHLLDELETHRQGIIDDIDTEFLHDYRVAVRRFRAIVGQLKDELDPDSMDKIRTGLKTISSETGKLRDLDVMILNQQYYTDLVPEQLQNGLTLFFNYIREIRKEAHAAASSYFSSPAYAEIIRNIETTCKKPANKLCIGGTVSVRQKAATVIEHRFTKLRQKISKFSKNKEIIHKIRIDCKKARYLLELFGQLYPGGGIKKMIKELKRFQTSLGNLHDIFVQHEMLVNSIHDMEQSEWNSPEATAAVGGLITVLSEKRTKFTAEAEKTLKNYKAKILFTV